MALLKEIEMTNGIKLKYHKISKISMEGSTTKVVVSCYTDSTYRDKEKTNFETKNRYESLLKSILDENSKEESLRDIKQISKWSDEANSIAYNFVSDLDLSVIVINYDFEDLKDLSLKNIYKLLKGTELLKDSEDLL